MKTYWLQMAGFWGMSLIAVTQAGELARIEEDFRNVPMEARRMTGPLFWLHGDESPDRLRSYLEKVAEGGNGSFTAESRPHGDWLGEGWYRDLAICLEAAKTHDLKMWIFDERWWPSQMVGGEVPPEYGSKYLDGDRTPIEGPRDVRLEGYGGRHFVAAVAGRETADGAIDVGTLLDLGAHIDEGRLHWEAPPGRWSILRFTWRYAGAAGHQKKWVSVDGASRDSVAWFIQHVYQPHYDRFGDDFGTTIAGYFYDEPETQGDWGTEVIPELQRRGVDWKAALVAWKFRLADAEAQTAAAYQYRDAFAEAWGRTLYGGMTDWCRAHGVRSIGHFMEHGQLYLHPTYCAGNLFQLQKYSDMGAIDLVCRQMYPGQRPHDIYQTPKLASSISHAYGKDNDLAMCEIFGGYEQELTYAEMKWLTDQHQVRGVNFMIPHSFNPRAPQDRDFPPYFYNDGREPRWPLYRVWADYTSRLSLLLTGGRHVCPVALLYLGNSYHAGKSVTPEDMTTALQDALFDCDWIPYDVFENDMDIVDRRLGLRREQYRVLVVPAAEVIPYPTLAGIKAFHDAGGVVIGYGMLPSKSATPGKTGADIAALTASIWGNHPEPGPAVCGISPGGGRAYFLPEKPTPRSLQRVLTDDAGIHPTLEVLEGDTAGWLHVLHRVKEEHDVFFITNQHHDGPVKSFRFRAQAAGTPECWDPMRNEVRSVPFARAAGGGVEFSLTLEPSESALVVFQPTVRRLPPRREATTRAKVPSIEVIRSSVQTGPAATPDNAESLLKGCPWVWHAGDPADVPPCTRYFRGLVELPANPAISHARIRLTADNDFVLFANGMEVGRGAAGYEDWRGARTLELTEFLHAGANTLAVKAVNFGDTPNPAGLIGAYTIVLADGSEIRGAIDRSWKSSVSGPAGWHDADFDDTDWSAIEERADYGSDPWKAFDVQGAGLTLPPIQRADPFIGTFTIPPDWLGDEQRIYLEAADFPHEAAAVATLNHRYAGGFIGKPFRLDITEYLNPGKNSVEIAPFAPGSLRIVRP